MPWTKYKRRNVSLCTAWFFWHLHSDNDEFPWTTNFWNSPKFWKLILFCYSIADMNPDCGPEDAANVLNCGHPVHMQTCDHSKDIFIKCGCKDTWNIQEKASQPVHLPRHFNKTHVSSFKSDICILPASYAVEYLQIYFTPVPLSWYCMIRICLPLAKSCPWYRINVEGSFCIMEIINK